MGAISFGIPKDLTLLLKNIFNVDVFIETGTYKGETTSWAAKNFKQVFTVEYSEVLYNTASAHLSKYQNIKCFFGNSVTLLPGIFDQINSPAILWLDAHWSGGDTFGINNQCPLLEEIAIIIQRVENHIIIIDDARIFLKAPSTFHAADQWPGLNEIVGLLSKRPGFYTFVAEDVIVSIPLIGKEKLQSYFNEIHKTEFPGGGIIRNIRFAARNISMKWKKILTPTR